MEAIPADAAMVFGDRVGLAQRYAELLAGDGAQRGVIGPHEGARIWTRHLLNCAAVASAVPPSARVLDIGSGAGLPGIPLALARPDLSVTLLEPLARRIAYLDHVVAALQVDQIAIVRSRAAEHAAAVGAIYDVVTARAVTNLVTLAEWARPLLSPGGIVIALKGERAADELVAARPQLRRVPARVVTLTAGLHHPAQVVILGPWTTP